MYWSHEQLREHRNLKLYPNPALPMMMYLWTIQSAKGTAKSQRVNMARLDTLRIMFFPSARHSTVTLGYGFHRMKARACRDIDS